MGSPYLPLESQAEAPIPLLQACPDRFTHYSRKPWRAATLQLEPGGKTMYSVAVEARRLATQLLCDHAKEGRFHVRIDDFDDLDLIAVRLREMGCTVDVDQIKRTLDINPPG